MMARIAPLEMQAATGRAKELLEELADRGTPPGTMIRAMATAPTLLREYLDLNRAMKRGHLDRRISERIALAMQAWIGCEYCLAAHADAAHELGLSESDIELGQHVVYDREECRMSTLHPAWATAFGAGCGRCARAA